ncbi:hypothetical protein [Streptomyces sp. NBC_00842]|uniref:hypothetical protein n=1 Tax=Streptomyces sp. NBC_00842 TaxID=2975848 RepID=UPI00386C4921|nr:hypothetical protein OH821_38530 [Streptomyces sp. NBC_00842]
MTTTLVRHIAPILLLVQVAYLALLEVAFTVLPPDTAELDHTDASAVNMALVRGITLAVTIAMTGAAALLGLAKIRTRAPRPIRIVWLVGVALGEVAIAVKALLSILSQNVGPDTAIGALIGTAALTIAAACVAELRSAAHITQRTAHA